MKIASFLAGTAVGCAVATTAHAAKLGDPAAPLAIKEWVKGKAVDVQDGKNIYVVEFWATWCAPCRVSIPHLTEMQKQFKDKGVVFIGVSNEPSDTVKPFVEQMAGKMDYVVAVDDGGKTDKGYLEAFGQDGIPCAFVVGKDGKVLWYGHPMDRLDETLKEILAGKYDLKAALRKDATRAKLDDYLKLSSVGEARARELGQELLKEAGTSVSALCDLAFAIASTTAEHRDFALAEDAIARAEKAAPVKDARLLGTRAVVLFESGKKAEGLAAVKRAIEASKSDSERAQYSNWLEVMQSHAKEPDPKN